MPHKAPPLVDLGLVTLCEQLYLELLKTGRDQIEIFSYNCLMELPLLEQYLILFGTSFRYPARPS